MRRTILIPALAFGLLAGAAQNAAAQTVSAGISMDGFYLQIHAGDPCRGGSAHRYLTPRQADFFAASARISPRPLPERTA